MGNKFAGYTVEDSDEIISDLGEAIGSYLENLYPVTPPKNLTVTHWVRNEVQDKHIDALTRRVFEFLVDEAIEDEEIGAHDLDYTPGPDDVNRAKAAMREAVKVCLDGWAPGYCTPQRAESVDPWDWMDEFDEDLYVDYALTEAYNTANDRIRGPDSLCQFEVTERWDHTKEWPDMWCAPNRRIWQRYGETSVYNVT